MNSQTGIAPTTRLMKPFSLFVPFINIERLSDEERIVEGYCYVNARVGDGFNLKRKAMMEATDDYMKWGAVREMHGSNAAGTAISAVWDNYGCLLRTKIVDDNAWKKCKEGVYKGFSVGVAPKVMRGEDVEKCLWYENSLVDRPADPDAKFMLVHKAGFDASQDVEVVVLPAKEKKQKNPPQNPSLERLQAGKDLTMKKTDLKSDNPVIQRMIVALPDEIGPEDITRFLTDRQTAEDAVVAVKTQLSTASETLTRVQGDLTRAETERTAAITRAETAEATVLEQSKKLIKRKAKMEELETRVTLLEKAPAITAPIRYENGVERKLADGTNPLVPAGENADKQAEAILKEFTDLQTSLPGELSQVKRMEGAGRLAYLGSQLSSMGVEVPV